MTEPTRRILLIGTAGHSLAHLQPSLQRFAFDVSQVVGPEVAIGKISATRFDVVIAEGSGDDEGVRRLAIAMRSAGSASSTSGLVVLAPPDRVRDMGRLVGRGVNKVLSTRESPEVIALVANRLGSTRHSLAERYPIHLRVSCHVDGAWRTWTTDNVSASGMLVRTDIDVPASTRFRFRLDTAGGSIEGEAKVVRVTDATRESVRGVGVRFAALDGDGRRRLADLLRSLSRTAEPSS